MLVYIIRNRINSKVYIGKTTKSLTQRFEWHVRDAKNPKRGKKLYKAMRELGIDNFFPELLVECFSVEELNETEETLIRQYNAVENGYNASYKAIGISEHSTASKLLMSQKRKLHSGPNKGVKFSEARRKRISDGHLGVRQTEETKLKISASHKGLNTWTLGRKQSKETREKRSIALKGKKQAILTCPHCGKSGGTTMKRWHFERCKQR